MFYSDLFPPLPEPGTCASIGKRALYFFYLINSCTFLFLYLRGKEKEKYEKKKKTRIAFNALRASYGLCFAQFLKLAIDTSPSNCENPSRIPKLTKFAKESYPPRLPLTLPGEDYNQAFFGRKMQQHGFFFLWERFFLFSS